MGRVICKTCKASYEADFDSIEDVAYLECPFCRKISKNPIYNGKVKDAGYVN